MFKNLLKKNKTDHPGQDVKKDPVCGMLGSEAIIVAYKGKNYYFCSDYCKKQFQINPEDFIKS